MPRLDITACFETFNQERFCSFPHRHGDATGKPETRDETCWSIKTGISCEPFLHFTLRSVKIDVFLRVLLRTGLKINVSCEAFVNFHHLSQMPSLQRNLHLVITSRSPATFKKKHMRLPCKMTSELSKVVRLLKTSQKYCACHTKRLATRRETCWSHEVPRLPREIKLCDAGKLEN